MDKTTRAWERKFKEKGKVFNGPHKDMDSVIQILKKRGAKRILDLGCGSGRHVIYFAKNGFSVFGLDNSPTGLDMTKKWLKEEGLEAELKEQEMTDKLPWDKNFFDAIVSIQVIHHADIATIKKIILELERVIKKGGLIFITVPKLKNQGSNFEQIEQNTYVPLDGYEKGLPHHYFTPGELRRLFLKFNVQNIHLDSGNHYCLLAYKL